MKIAVIGAGHAGVAAAEAAAKAGARVSLFSNEAALPYFRPRLVAVAFGQAEPGAVAMHPEAWYSQNGIGLKRESAVVGLDATARELRVRVSGGPPVTESFDGVVIAAGAEPTVPVFPGTGGKNVAPLWRLSDAQEIRRAVSAGKRLAVIGGGLIGIETAVRATMAGLEVTIVEKAPRLMAANLGETAAGLLRRLLEGKGVRVLTGVSIAEIRNDAGANSLVLEDGRRHEFDLGLACIGARVNLDTWKGPGIQTGRGIIVDSTLRTAAPGVYACGDIAQVGDAVRCSALRASAQGRIAGRNAAAGPGGGQPARYEASAEPVFLKCGDIEVHAFGRVADNSAPGLSEALMDAPSERACRVRVAGNGKPAGVQMIGTKADFDKLVREIA